MKKNIRFVGLLTKLKLSHIVVFRLTFFGAFFADGLLFAIQLLVFDTIFGNIDKIGSWNQAQMIIFIGTFSLIKAISKVVFADGIRGLPSKIRSGSLDNYLTKPVSPLMRITFESMDPGGIPLVVMSILIIGFGVSSLGTAVTLVGLSGYIFMVMLMIVLWYEVSLVIRIIPFIVISSNAITRLEELSELCFKVPGILFKGLSKVVFYLILPYGIMATIPTQILSKTVSAWEILYGLGIVIVFSILTKWFWRFGLSNYKSASS